MAPRLENRSARRVAATEREKRRMESFNVKVDTIRDLVCPTMKSATKAKVLRAAVERLLYLESLASKITGQTIPQVYTNNLQPDVKIQVNEQLNYQAEMNQSEYSEVVYQPSSSSDSFNSWNSPVDYSQTYTEDYATQSAPTAQNITFYDDNANMYPPNNYGSYESQPEMVANQVIAHNEDAQFPDSFVASPESELQQPEMTPADHFFKEFEAELNQSIL